MGRLEKYGVCALLFVIVTVLAVSIWGPRPKKGTPGKNEGKTATATPATASPAPASTTGARPLDGGTGVASGAGRVEGAAGPAAAPGSGAAPPSPFDQPTIALPGANAPSFTPAGPARRYAVRSGDTLETIAKAQLGSSLRWEELRKWNEGLDPKRLRVGQEIVLPPSATPPATLVAAAADRVAPSSGSAVPAVLTSPPSASPLATAAPAAAGGASGKSAAAARDRTHRVAKGDTLYAIAKRYYGKGTRFHDIVAANSKVLSSADDLRVGMTLVIP